MTQQEILKALQYGQEIVKKTSRVRKGKGYFVRESLFLGEQPLSKYDFDSVNHLIEEIENRQTPFTHYKLKL